MAAVFSSNPMSQSDSTLELQLLPDHELLSLWEQIQKAAWAIQEGGMNPDPASHYADTLLWEMQRRIMLNKSHDKRFGSDEGSSLPDGAPALPHIMAMPLA